MAYVVVVFAIINTLALGAVGWWLWITLRDLPRYVESAIADEVRRQDDRIEKRQSRAAGPPDEEAGTPTDGVYEPLQVGRPMRRQ